MSTLVEKLAAARNSSYVAAEWRNPLWDVAEAAIPAKDFLQDRAASEDDYFALANLDDALDRLDAVLPEPQP